MRFSTDGRVQQVWQIPLGDIGDDKNNPDVSGLKPGEAVAPSPIPATADGQTSGLKMQFPSSNLHFLHGGGQEHEKGVIVVLEVSTNRPLRQEGNSLIDVPDVKVKCSP